MAERGTARVFLESLGRSRAALLGGIHADRQVEEAELLARLRRLEERMQRRTSRSCLVRGPASA